MKILPENQKNIKVRNIKSYLYIFKLFVVAVVILIADKINDSLSMTGFVCVTANQNCLHVTLVAYATGALRDH